MTAESPIATSTASRSGFAETLSTLLDSLSIGGGPARDGDCLAVAPRVTRAVREFGIPADTVTVSGWFAAAALRSAFPDLGCVPGADELRVLGFCHQVTVAMGWVLDATAQQFRVDLPERWTAPLEQYLERLAAATGVADVTVGPVETVVPVRRP